MALPLKTPDTLGEKRTADTWGALRLIARDLGFSVAGEADLKRSGSGSLSRFRAGSVPTRVPPGDLTSLELENSRLIRSAGDQLSALGRAGHNLGLAGSVVLSETSGVLLRVVSFGAVEEPAPLEPGNILSLRAAGPNPVGLAVNRAAVALVPPPPAASGPSVRRPRPLSQWWGIGAPLGAAAIPLGCLAVLPSGPPSESTEALLAQALFAARAIELDLALHHERSAHLEVAAGLAHEVRNPLTAVKGFLQLSYTGKGDAHNYAGIALRELDRALSLLEDYSLFSRAPRIIPSSPVGLDSLLSEAAVVARGLAAADPGIRIRYEGCDENLIVPAEPQRLKQVMLNLCRNAVEAMPHGGELVLAAKQEGAEAVVEVSDTGVGIPPEALNHLFEPFYTTKAAGTGLGLSVCRRIVEAHGGRMAVESRPGRGSTFRVYLPVCPAL